MQRLESLYRRLIRPHLDSDTSNEFSFRGTVIFFPGVRKYHDLPVSRSPAVLSSPVSATDGVAAAIAHVEQTVERNRRVKAVAKATEAMLNAHDERLVFSAGPHLPRAKSYIRDRCIALVGVTVAAALRLKFPDTSGTLRRYSRADLDWDVRHD